MAKTKKRARGAGGRFKKGGSKALVRTRTRTITKYRSRRAPVRYRRRRGRRGGGGGGGGVTAGKLAVAAIGLAALTADTSPIAPAKVKELVAKAPGAKTFGNVAIAGLGLGALWKFTSVGGRFRPWMAAAGVVGLVAAGIKLGTDNTGFKFVGDDDDDMVADVEG